MFPQKKDIEIYRGDKRALTFTVVGDLTQTNLFFTVKESKDFSADRIIELKNKIAGGSDEEITVTFDSKISIINVWLREQNTGWLTSNIAYYDLSADFDSESYFYGELIIVKDVRTKFDGIPLDSETARYVLIDTENFEDETLLLYSKSENAFIPIELSDVKVNELYDEEIDLFNIVGVTPNTDRLRKVVKQLVTDVLQNSNIISDNLNSIEILQIENDSRLITDEEIDLFNIEGITPNTDRLRKVVENNLQITNVELVNKQIQIDEINLFQDELDINNIIGV